MPNRLALGALSGRWGGEGRGVSGDARSRVGAKRQNQVTMPRRGRFAAATAMRPYRGHATSAAAWRPSRPSSSDFFSGLSFRFSAPSVALRGAHLREGAGQRFDRAGMLSSAMRGQAAAASCSIARADTREGPRAARWHRRCAHPAGGPWGPRAGEQPGPEDSGFCPPLRLPSSFSGPSAMLAQHLLAERVMRVRCMAGAGPEKRNLWS